MRRDCHPGLAVRAIFGLTQPRCMATCLALWCVALFGCNPYGVEIREVSGPRWNFFEDSRREEVREPKVRALNGRPTESELELNLETMDSCRVKTLVPRGRVVTTERTLEAPFASILVSSAAATGLYYVAPNSVIGLSAIAGAALGHITWMIVASHDSETRVTDEWRQEDSPWHDCYVAPPVGAPVALEVRHEDGAVTKVGSAKLGTDGRIRIPLRDVGASFGEHGSGNVMAVMEGAESSISCGDWQACIRSESCATLRHEADRAADRAASAFHDWSKSKQGASYATSAEQLVGANGNYEGSRKQCPGQMSDKSLSQWQERLSTLRMPADATTELPRLMAMAAEVSASSDKFNTDMEVARLKAWRSELSKELGRRIALAQAACQTVAQELKVLRKQGAWSEILSRRPSVVGRCAESSSSSAISEAVAWAASARCRNDRTQANCQEACGLGLDEGCRAVAELDAAAARQEAQRRSAAEAEERQRLVVAAADPNRQEILLNDLEEQTAAFQGKLKEYTSAASFTKLAQDFVEIEKIRHVEEALPRVRAWEEQRLVFIKETDATLREDLTSLIRKADALCTAGRPRGCEVASTLFGFVDKLCEFYSIATENRVKLRQQVGMATEADYQREKRNSPTAIAECRAQWIPSSVKRPKQVLGGMETLITCGGIRLQRFVAGQSVSGKSFERALEEAVGPEGAQMCLRIMREEEGRARRCQQSPRCRCESQCDEITDDTWKKFCMAQCARK